MELAILMTLFKDALAIQPAQRIAATIPVQNAVTATLFRVAKEVAALGLLAVDALAIHHAYFLVIAAQMPV